MATAETATASPSAHYNPVADVFGALVKFDRPVDIHQLRKALPKMPDGTISSTLTKLREAKVIDRTEGQRPALWRALRKELPKELNGPGRLAAPRPTGLKRPGRGAGLKSNNLLVVLPVGRKDSITCTERDARALYAALGRLLGAGRA